MVHRTSLSLRSEAEWLAFRGHGQGLRAPPDVAVGIEEKGVRTKCKHDERVWSSLREHLGTVGPWFATRMGIARWRLTSPPPHAAARTQIR